MLPTGKAHQEDLRRLFSKPGPHIFKDATIPIAFVGPHVVESLILSPSPKSLEVAFLLSKAIDWCDRSQLNSLLRTSAKYANSYFVSSLIDSGADVNSRDIERQSAMSLAVKSGDINTVRVLIESGYAIDNTVDRFLHDAAAMNRLDLIKILCLGYADIDMNSVDSKGRIPLHLAAIQGNLELLQFLVSVGSDADAGDDKGWTPLHYAAAEGHTEAVGILLDYTTFAKYVLTREGKSPYDLAGDNNNSDLYDMLHFRDELHRAARLDDVQEMKNLLSKGANVNSRDQNGWTPLHRAAFKGGIETVKLLLSHGAQIDLVDDIGYSPLHLAVEGAHSQVALHLIANGARSNLKSLKTVVSQHPNDFKNHPSMANLNQVYQEKEIA